MRVRRPPPHPGLFLVLALFIAREADAAWIRGEIQNTYRPSRDPGGPFLVTPLKPDPAVRWTFEGINYDSPPHQVATNVANREYGTCAGDYVRCILRDSKPAEICALDSWAGYYYRFYTICDVEYQNCLNTNAYYGHKYNRLDHTMNRFLYDGDGWKSNKDASSWFYTWYCYWADIQFYYHGMRRTSAEADGTTKDKGKLQ